MAKSSEEKNSVKTSWIHIEISAPIIVFVALPIIFLTFACVHGFKDDYITILLLTFTGIVTIIFLLLNILKPENLTLNGQGHLLLKRDAAKKKVGGQT